MGKFLSITDSLPGIDTIDLDRKLLVAYYQNDTSYLRKSVDVGQGLLKKRHEMLRYPSCIEPVGIDSYSFKEAYSFQYGAAFCDQILNLTVGERNDSIFLLGYHYKMDYLADTCLSFTKIKRLLTIRQWKIIHQSVLRTDFWGLKPRNDRQGTDGSALTVIGYQRPGNAFQGRYNKVYRWSAEEMALGELFKTVLEMSGIKGTCFHFN